MIILENAEKRKISAAVFDFDGTLSTLRCGWEQVMEPLMLEVIYGDHPTDEEVATVREYISASTGIQTILQMKWICEMVEKRGGTPLSAWDYKAEYNRRLMENVLKRREEARLSPEKFLMKGGPEFLAALKARGVKIYAASGTDDADVKLEAEALGIAKYFDEIAGALPFSEDCSKEATLKRLIGEGGSDGLIVVGDGPVEIRLGREAGATTVGIVGKESELSGYDEVKIKRLTAAGAHILCDCFAEADEIFEFIEG